MRAVVQRVNHASVTVDKKIVSKIEKGLLIFVVFSNLDTISDLEYILNKILGLRIFEDENEKMNLSVMDKNYEILVVSQFTLYGDCRKGKRPNFMESLNPTDANILYEKFLEMCREKISVKSGIFGADMKILLENDGPVTIQLDSSKLY